jgi:hypothetical protein
MTERVEALLREVGTRLEVPRPPELTGTVLARLAGGHADEVRPSRLTRLVPRLVATVVVALLALGVAMAVSPTVRAAVFDLLRIGGVEIHHDPDPPAPPASGAPLLPGERVVTVEQARAAADFEVAVPAVLGEPDEVRISDGMRPRVVSLLYRPGTAAAVRVDQFDGEISPVFYKMTNAQDVELVGIGTAQGAWIPRPHPVHYVDRNGRTQEESARLAGRTLVWEAGGVTYRLEGELSRDEAVRIAESIR